MRFSLLFWNIWIDNQIAKQTQGNELIDELDEIINLYKPDFTSLAEVAFSESERSSPVLDYLKSLGHAHRFTLASPLNDIWLYGSAISTRLTIDGYEEIEFGPDLPAERRGYPGFNRKIAAVKLQLPSGQSLKLFVVHLMPLHWYSLKNHYRAAKKLEEIVRSEQAENVVLIGDFNETAHLMPNTFKKNTKDIMDFKTGSLRNPTWRYNAKWWTPIRANPDQLFYHKKGKIKLVDFKTINTQRSDHRPIYAVFEAND